MMEKIDDNREWGLIRNNNGEWICDEHAVTIPKSFAKLIEARNTKCGNAIPIYHGPDGTLWCYKHQLEKLFHNNL